jgi:hypothetical protein
MSFCLSFHLSLLNPTGAYWLDDPPDRSSNDGTRHYSADGPRLSCNQLSLTSPAPLLWGCS